MNPMEFLERPDPAKDRAEFERRLRRSNHWTEFYSIEEAVEAVIVNDTEKLDKIRTCKKSCDQHVATYLSQYDSLESEEDKKNLVGQVKRFKEGEA